MTDVKFDFESYLSDEHLFGTAVSNSHYYYSFTTYDNKYYWGMNGNNTSASSWTTGNHTLIFNDSNSNVILDETIIGSSTNTTSTANLLIGRRGTSTTLSGKIYYFKITDKSTGNLVRYFVPAVRNTDSVAGMYDIVNDLFYTNAGTGTFTVPE